MDLPHPMKTPKKPKPTAAGKAAEKAAAKAARAIAKAAAKAVRVVARAEARELARERRSEAGRAARKARQGERRAKRGRASGAQSEAGRAARKAKRDAHWRKLERMIERVDIKARHAAKLPYTQVQEITAHYHELAKERARLLCNYKAALDAPPGASPETATIQQKICK
jgi:hypothetical protein